MEVLWNMFLVLLTLIGVAISVIFLLYKRYPWLKYDWHFIKQSLVFAKLRKYKEQNKTLVNIFEEKAMETPNKTFLIFEDVKYSYEMMNTQMNKMAHTGQQMGLKTGDVVAILMYNAPDFIWTWHGQLQICITALIK